MSYLCPDLNGMEKDTARVQDALGMLRDAQLASSNSEVIGSLMSYRARPAAGSQGSVPSAATCRRLLLFYEGGFWTEASSLGTGMTED